MISRLSHRLSEARTAGRPLLNGWMMTPEPAVLETLHAHGWDSLTLDLQHGQIDAASARTLIRTAEGLGLPLLARPAWNDAAQISRLLDDGFEGLICPMVNSAAEAQALAAATLYPPAGGRSFGPVRASAVRGGDYWRDIAEHLVVLAMIETREALVALPGILCVDGIAGVYVGPADLGLSLIGEPTREPDQPSIITTIDGIRAAAQSAGKIAAIHNTTAGHAARMAGKGWDLVTGPSDLGLLATASIHAVQTIRAGFPDREQDDE